MRKPIANKTHYANGPTLLDKQFEEIFNDKRGPGAMPLKKSKDNDVKGIIVPHAPYNLAGPCAAWAYDALAEGSGDVDFYFIIAQAQNSTKTGVTMQTFVTPYGEVRIDQNFVRELVAKGNITLNDEVHNEESVIEVQLPFLQFINKSKMEKVRIVPLIVNAETNFNELSVDIKETLVELKKTCAFIFVSNFTAYGRGFKYVPFTENIGENIALVDKKMLDPLKIIDEENFFTAVEETMAPISGYASFKLMFRLLQPSKILLEQYYQSGDVNDNYSNSISYASLVIK